MEVDEKESTSEDWSIPQSLQGSQSQSQLAMGLNFSKSRNVLDGPPSPIFEEDVKNRPKTAVGTKSNSKRSTPNSLAGLEGALDQLSLQQPSRDSTAVIPHKTARQKAVAHGGPNVEYVPKGEEVDTVKKKKRPLNKKSTASASNAEPDEVDSSRSLRRSVRNSRSQGS